MKRFVEEDRWGVGLYRRISLTDETINPMAEACNNRVCVFFFLRDEISTVWGF